MPAATLPDTFECEYRVLDCDEKSMASLNLAKRGRKAIVVVNREPKAFDHREVVQQLLQCEIVLFQKESLFIANATSLQRVQEFKELPAFQAGKVVEKRLSPERLRFGAPVSLRQR